MQKTKRYEAVRFTEDVLRSAVRVFREQIPIAPGKDELNMIVEVDDAEWNHDVEEEFFADYRRSSEFSRSAIKETFGEIVATIRREFPDKK